MLVKNGFFDFRDMCKCFGSRAYFLCLHRVTGGSKSRKSKDWSVVELGCRASKTTLIFSPFEKKTTVTHQRSTMSKVNCFWEAHLVKIFLFPFLVKFDKTFHENQSLKWLGIVLKEKQWLLKKLGKLPKFQQHYDDFWHKNFFLWGQIETEVSSFRLINRKSETWFVWRFLCFEQNMGIGNFVWRSKKTVCVMSETVWTQFKSWSWEAK